MFKLQKFRAVETLHDVLQHASLSTPKTRLEQIDLRV
jgi:hypothetical protein